MKKFNCLVFILFVLCLVCNFTQAVETKYQSIKFGDIDVETEMYDAETIDQIEKVDSLNGLTGNVSLVEGENVTITTNGNELTISSSSDGLIPVVFTGFGSEPHYETNVTKLIFDSETGFRHYTNDNEELVVSLGSAWTTLYVDEGEPQHPVGEEPLILTTHTTDDKIKWVEPEIIGGKEVKKLSIGIGGNTDKKGAFYQCTSLKSVYIPGTVKTLGRWMFDGCTSLVNVTLEEGIEDINRSAFCNCSNLKYITLPNSTTTIGDWAFGRDGLFEIVIPDNVVSIGASSFESCSSMASITVGTGLNSVGTAFKSCSKLRTIKYYRRENESVEDAESRLRTLFNNKGIPNYSSVTFTCLNPIEE